MSLDGFDGMGTRTTRASFVLLLYPSAPIYPKDYIIRKLLLKCPHLLTNVLVARKFTCNIANEN